MLYAIIAMGQIKTNQTIKRNIIDRIKIFESKCGCFESVFKKLFAKLV